MASLALLALAATAVPANAQYATSLNLVRDFSGVEFWNGWDFYGYWDNLTLGNVNYLNETAAMQDDLAYYDSSTGHVIIKVDNTTYVESGQNRNSVRITTADAYDVGSLWVLDAYHIPYGCSVWPAFWTFGPNWPAGGEIDTIEAINNQTYNEMALHTDEGCSASPSANFSGALAATDCGTATGCVVNELKPNSYGADFSTAGGGVFATLFDASGIYIWFWSRPDVPAAINSTTNSTGIDISTFGEPSAAYPNSSCNITEYFTPQNIVIDTTLCGQWAGAAYDASCQNYGPTGICYNDTVVGPGSPTYDEAYWEINYMRVYTTGTPSSTGIPSPTFTYSGLPSASASASGSSDQTSGAVWLGAGVERVVVALGVCVVAGVMGAVVVL